MSRGDYRDYSRPKRFTVWAGQASPRASRVPHSSSVWFQTSWPKHKISSQTTKHVEGKNMLKHGQICRASQFIRLVCCKELFEETHRTNEAHWSAQICPDYPDSLRMPRATSSHCSGGLPLTPGSLRRCLAGILPFPGSCRSWSSLAEELPDRFKRG